MTIPLVSLNYCQVLSLLFAILTLNSQRNHDNVSIYRYEDCGRLLSSPCLFTVSMCILLNVIF